MTKRGRPATGHDPSISTRLPAALLAALDERARDDHSSRSEVIREALVRLLALPSSSTATPASAPDTGLPVVRSKGASAVTGREPVAEEGEPALLAVRPGERVSKAERARRAAVLPEVAKRKARTERGSSRRLSEREVAEIAGDLPDRKRKQRDRTLVEEDAARAKRDPTRCPRCGASYALVGYTHRCGGGEG